LEEVVEKLVDIVTFIRQEISEAFGDNVAGSVGKKSIKKPERLGVAGLALHYANIITHIDNVASRPTSLPPNMRDTLYHGLPSSVKAALRSQLQTVDADEVLTIPQIKAEMEKTLQWLVPVAMDTTKAHQGFGWVGEWANTGSEFGKKTTTHHNIIRIQTLHHADKKKMDSYILELVTWLHCLISRVSYRDKGRKPVPPVHSPIRKGWRNNCKVHGAQTQLSTDDKNLLEEVMKRRRLVPGLSKSQEFAMGKKRGGTKVWGLSRSTGSSPRREFEYRKSSLLDILDGLDTKF